MHSLKVLKIAIGAVLSLGVALTVVGAVGVGQSPSPVPANGSKYVPTEVQALKLQVAQKDAQLAQVQLQRAQQAFQAALAQLDSIAGEVKKANGWPSEVQFSPDTLQFETPKLPTPMPAPEKKP